MIYQCEGYIPVKKKVDNNLKNEKPMENNKQNNKKTTQIKTITVATTRV